MTTGESSDGHPPPGPPHQRLFWPWLALSAACILWMWRWPDLEVIPYHVIWLGFALLYGFEPWALRRTAVALAVVTATSGAVLSYHVGGGESWEETFEIPLMLGLSVLIVWHVQRREAALRKVNALARQREVEAVRRERLGRLTSHEMRTPLTIAACYVELLGRDERDPGRIRDFAVLRDELDRLERASDRLLRMVQTHEHLARTWFATESLLAQTVDRWSTVANRRWIVESTGGALHASQERIVACLDTLVENAVRYTAESDTVRLFATQHDDHVLIGVADSGPGLAAEQAMRVNSREPRAAPDPAPAERTPDPLSQTGLGIGLVQEILEAREGRLLAGRSREGGALFVIYLPVDRAAA